jgi:hypothetical protein
MDAASLPFGYRFDASTDRQREREVRAVVSELEENQEILKCAACGLLITYRDAGIAMGGQHARWFTNPGGYSYQVGCFDRAPGCSHLGADTEEHSWFPGYAWTIALCAGCGIHLGWRFRSRADQFYGLILDRMIASASN